MVKSYLISCLWSLIVVCTFFGAIELQKQINAGFEKRADAKEFSGWCNVDMQGSKATIECNRMSRLDN